MQTPLKKKLFTAIEKKVFPGCVVGVVNKGGQRVIIPLGRFSYDSKSTLVKEDTIYDVASITKSIPTSSLALKLIDEGRLKLQDKLIDFVPEFRNSQRERVLIKHLLTHTIDFKSPGSDFRLSSYKNKTPDEILTIILTTEFRNNPGKKFSYINATSILLGLVIEAVAKRTLDELAKEVFFKPLKMDRSTFQPELFAKDKIAPTEFDKWRGRLIQGEVHDESAYVLGKKQVVGSAGLFSTVPDLLNFLEMLLGNGKKNAKKFFSSGMVKEMYTNQLGSIGETAGLGWELNQPRYMGKYANGHTFGKTGFTGCFCICDLKKGVGLVMLANYTFPKRKPDASKINQVRRQISNIVLK